MLCPPPMPYASKVDTLKWRWRIEPTGEINWTTVHRKRLRKTIRRETSQDLAGQTSNVAI